MKLLCFVVMSSMSLLGQVPTAPIVPSDSSGGAVTSVSGICGLSANLSGRVATFTRSPGYNIQTGSTYTLDPTDCGGLVVANNPSGVSISIPHAVAPYGVGFFFDILATGNGGATIIPTTSTIDGQATYTVAKNQSIHISSDGANWQVSKGAPVWGNIAGTLANQSDLQTALNAKQAALGYTPYNILDLTTQTWRYSGCSVDDVNGSGPWFSTYSGNNDNCAVPASADDVTYYNVDTGATSGNAARFELRGAGQGGGYLGPVLAAATFRNPKVYGRQRITSNATVYYAIGIYDGIAPDHNVNNMVGIKYDAGVDTHYRCIVKVGGTLTANVDTGVAVNTNFNTFKVDTVSGTVTCTVNGTAVTATATFPTANNLYAGSFIETTANASVNLHTNDMVVQISGLAH